MAEVHFENLAHLRTFYPQFGSLSPEKQNGLFAVVTTAFQMDPRRRFSLDEVLGMLPSLRIPAALIERKGYLVERGRMMLDPNEDVDFTTYPFAIQSRVDSLRASMHGDYLEAVLIQARYRAAQDAVMLALDPALLRTRIHYILAHAAVVEALGIQTDRKRRWSYQSEMELYSFGVSDCRLVDLINQRGKLVRRPLVHMPLDLHELGEKWSACILPGVSKGREVFLHPSKTAFNLQPIHHPAVLPKLVIPKLH